MGTVWTGGDVSARYERARIAAQRKANQDNRPVPTSISQSHPDSGRASTVYQDDAANAKDLLLIPLEMQQPAAPGGQAAQQASASRQQVLEDQKDGGARILAEEAHEEQDARKVLRRSVRRKTGSSTPQADSLKGLRDRVTGSMHGRTGGIIGMESSR